MRPKDHHQQKYKKKFKSHITRLVFLLFIVHVLFTSVVFAQTKKKKSPAEVSPPPVGFERTLIDQHNAISKVFDDLANRLDIFLAGNKLSKTRNKTRVFMEHLYTLTDGASAYSAFNIGLNLSLPNTEKYWQLKFTNYDQQTENRGVRGSYLRQKNAARNYGATAGFFRSFENVQFAFRPRILLEDPLNISHSMEFSTALKNDIWDFNPRLEFFATPSKGTGIFTSLNTGYQINNTYSITFVNEFEYQEKENLFTATQGTSFGQVLNDISSLSYNLFFISTNRPNYQLDNYNFSTAYAVILYKDILETQIVPGVTFSKNVGYRGVGSIGFNLRVYF